MDLQAECRMKHFWQFLIIAISWKYVGRRPIRFVTAPCICVFHSPAIFAVLHWSFVFKHRTLLCCLILVTISVGRKYKDCSFWWCSLHEVNTSRRCVLDDQWRWYSNYSCTRITVDGPPTRVRVSRSLLALLTYEYPGGYGLIHSVYSCFFIKSQVTCFWHIFLCFHKNFVERVLRHCVFCCQHITNMYSLFVLLCFRWLADVWWWHCGSCEIWGRPQAFWRRWGHFLSNATLISFLCFWYLPRCHI